MIQKRDSQLALLEILKTYTDENHILTNKELIYKINEEYGIELERRTIYSLIDSLIDLGYDISSYQENGVGYYLRDRDFSQGEVLLLCNAVHASNLLPRGESKRVIETLLNTQSKYIKESFNKCVYMDNFDKKNDKHFFDNFEIISKAIKEKKNISFYYTKYDEYLHVVKKREEPYIVSPIHLVAKNGTAYLASKSEHHEGFGHYRLDRMVNVKVVEGKYLRSTKNEDPYSYFKTQANMFAGEPVTVEIRVEKYMIDTLVDEFGKDIFLRKDTDDDSKLLATLKVTKEGMKYYGLRFADCMEILSPKDLRKEVKDILFSAYKKYNK